MLPPAALFAILGQRHLDHLVAEWVEHYHTERPHQAKDNELLALRHPLKGKTGKRKGETTDPPTLGQVKCRERLGGLVKHYYRKAA